jgi:predicted dehydrogenase
MKEILSLAIVGAGIVAQTHLASLKKTKSLNVVAVCDMNEELARKTAEKWGVESYYGDFHEMMKRENLDIVSILTPPQSHAALAIEAIQRGANVLVEKPLTSTAEEARMILDALKGSSVKLTVVYHHLFSRAVGQSLELVKSGGIGKLLGMNVTFLHTIHDPMASDRAHWCHRIPGGRFGEMLPHPVYLIQGFMGNELYVDSVVAEKRGPYPWLAHDELVVTVHALTGIANLYVSFNAPRPAELLDIYGTERILRVDLTNQTIVSLGYRTSSKISSVRDILGLTNQLMFATARNAVLFSRGGRGEYSIRSTYARFLDSIMKGIQPPVDRDMAYGTVKVVEEICGRLLSPEHV